MPEAEFHGLAANIRSATESETFDFGGLPSTTISQVVGDTFSRGFDLDGGEMIRITLVVGAGKGNRSKYDPAALKLVTTSLTAAGYVEDRGASCTMESAGCFKFQHDTGKNLKTVVIFPTIAEGRGIDESKAGLPSSSSLLPPNSLEYKIAVSTVSLFENMLKFKFQSWSQKRSLLKLVDETLMGPLESLDENLMRGGIMSDDETTFYEQCVSVSEKKALIKDAMSHQVLESKLTASEVDFLLEQVAARVEELKSRNQAIPNVLQERQAKLQTIAKNPISPLPLKHHAALGKLWKQAAPLMYLNNSGGKLLSPAETKKRGQLEDILGEIASLEESSKGLLEDDESYEERIRTYRRDLQQRFGNIHGGNNSRKKPRGAVSGTLSSKDRKNTWSSTTKFQTPGVGGKGRGGWMAGQAKKSNKGQRNKGDLFGAMMADSDSDSGSEGEGQDKDESAALDSRNAPISAPTNTNAIGANKKKKNKKKNKNKKKGNRNMKDDDEFLDAAVAANTAASEKDSKLEQESSTPTDKNETNAGAIISSVLLFLFSALKDYVIPLISAILIWFANLLFGTNKKKKKKM